MSTRRIHQCIMFPLCAVVSVSMQWEFYDAPAVAKTPDYFTGYFAVYPSGITAYRSYYDTVNSRYTRMFLVAMCRRSIVRPHSLFSVSVRIYALYYVRMSLQCISVRMPTVRRLHRIVDADKT